jgi:hypothetical protein
MNWAIYDTLLPVVSHVVSLLTWDWTLNFPVS